MLALENWGFGFGDVLIADCYGLVESVVGTGLVGYIASDVEFAA